MEKALKILKYIRQGLEWVIAIITGCGKEKDNG